MTTTRDRSSIRIYIVSPRLIHKQKHTISWRRGLKSQLFPGKKVTIKILEKYHLSGQYTPKKLMDVYRDSILMELKNYSILLYNMFRRAVLSFDEKDLLTMEIEDTMIAKDKAPELVRILEKILRNAVTFRWSQAVLPPGRGQKKGGGGACRHLYERGAYIRRRSAV